MKHYKIDWKYPINETELRALLEEWHGFFTVEEVVR